MLLDPRLVGYTIDGLWLIFLCYWISNAFTNKRSIYRQSRRSRLLYLVIAFVFLYAVFHCPPLSKRVLPRSMVVQIAGIALCAMGITFAIWARRTLGRNWSGIVTLKKDHVLIRHGPYQFVRHPIYSGVILAAAGTIVATLPDLRGVLFLLFLFAALRLKSLLEEKILSQTFPEEYPRYMREVKALIPFVY